MKEIIKKHYDLLTVALLSIYILFFYGDKTPVMFNDSQGYIDLAVFRSPLYPLWLLFFRKTAGADYLQTVIFAQSILALLSVLLILYIMKFLFGYKSWLTFVLWPFVIYPYVAGLTDGVLYNRTVLTEGLSYPLFYLYMAFFLYALVRKSGMFLLFSFMLSGLMMVLRGQMRETLVFSLLLGIYLLAVSLIEKKKTADSGESAKKNKPVRLAAIILAGALFAVIFSKSFNYVYTTAVHGESYEPEFENTSMMINFLYCADERDSELFKDDEDYDFIRMAFDKTFESGYIYGNRGTTLAERNDHLMDANLYLKLHMFIPDAEDYYGAKGLTDVQVYKKYEEIAGKMEKELVPRHLFQWLGGFFSLFFYGTASAVFFRLSVFTSLCYFIAYALMLSAIILAVFCFIKKRAMDAAEFMAGMCIMATGNLAVCCAAIGATERYLSYTWGLFYVAGIILIYSLIFRKNKKAD